MDFGLSLKSRFLKRIYADPILAPAGVNGSLSIAFQLLWVGFGQSWALQSSLLPELSAEHLSQMQFLHALSPLCDVIKRLKFLGAVIQSYITD